MERFSDALVAGIRWLIGGIETVLGPLALTAGQILALALLLLGPGIATHVASRVMSRGTEKTFGRFDALLTMIMVACCLGCVWGLMLAGAVIQGRDALIAAGTIGVTVGIGLCTGSWSVLRLKPTMFIVSLYAVSGVASCLFVSMT